MSVIDPVTNTVIGTVGVGDGPRGLAVSPTGGTAGYVFVANTGSDTVSVIDAVTNTVIGTVGVGVLPSGVAVSPIGAAAGNVYVTNGGGAALSVLAGYLG
ncbi:YncE family protein [Mycobacterium bourgelatii]|uniref:YncE family protein n=1 Tax=Mycobacterium bourgelatii TaxID=1273442 RepID=UPI0035308B78